MLKTERWGDEKEGAGYGKPRRWRERVQETQRENIQRDHTCERARVGHGTGRVAIAGEERETRADIRWFMIVLASSVVWTTQCKVWTDSCALLLDRSVITFICYSPTDMVILHTLKLKFCTPDPPSKLSFWTTVFVKPCLWPCLQIWILITKYNRPKNANKLLGITGELF